MSSTDGLNLKLAYCRIHSIVQEFTPYYRMLLPLVGQAWGALSESADESNPAAGRVDSASVRLGIPAAKLMLEDDPSLYAPLTAGVKRLIAYQREALVNPSRGQSRPPLMLADTLGHRRDVYWPLVLHVYLSAFARRYETLPSRLWSACEETLSHAVQPLRWIDAYTESPPPAYLYDQVLWHALCLCEQSLLTGRDADVEWLDAVVHQIIHRPGLDGCLHPNEPPRPVMDQSSGTEDLTDKVKVASERLARGSTAAASEANEDAWVYRELCGLHALANLALLRRHQAWAQRVEQVASYHLQHTQPDHVTSQPWALFAFIWSPKTRLFADQQIHDATASAATTGVGRSASLSVVSGLLLADAAASLSTFFTANPDDERGLFAGMR